MFRIILAVIIVILCLKNYRDNDGYNIRGRNESGYDRKGFDKEGYDRWGYDRNGYNRWGWTKDRINRETGTKYDKDGFNRNGFNKYGIHKITGTKIDCFGYDKNGYQDGWTTNISCEYGNYKGFGINKETGTKYDKDGYDVRGYDERGFDKNGKYNGYNSYYDNQGYDVNGYDRQGFDKDGYDKYGWSKRGWSRKGINRETGTKYDKNGYDRRGYDKDGFNEDGYDDSCYDRRGFRHSEGYVDGHRYMDVWVPGHITYYYEPGYPNKYTGTKYDKEGYDYYGVRNPKMEKLDDKKPEKNYGKGNKKRKNICNKVTDLKHINICSIASGSNGNCYYIGTDDEAILIDDGISYKQLSLRMKEVNLDINSIKGIFISHEHSDHIYGLPIFYKNHPNVPIYFNEKAYSSVKYKYDPGSYKKGVINLEDKVVKLGGFKIYPFKKIHDASYPLSFRVEYNGISVGVFTDIGESSTKFQNHFSKCNAVFLESNHDVTMLKNGPYDTYLRQRVYETHFSNDDAYNMLKKYANPNLQVVVLVHISEKNNTIKEVEEKFKKFRKKYKIEIASRHAVGEVHEILINN